MRPAREGWPGRGARCRRRRDRPIERLSLDLPVVVEIVDTREKLEAFLAEVDPLIHEGLATLEDAEVRFYRSGRAPDPDR
jgi:uncharacterized protein